MEAAAALQSPVSAGPRRAETGAGECRHGPATAAAGAAARGAVRGPPVRGQPPSSEQ